MNRHVIRRAPWVLLSFPALLCCLGVTGGRTENAQVDPPPGYRDKLTVQDLRAGVFPGLLHNDYYMPIGEALPAGFDLSGVIRFEATQMTTGLPDTGDWGSGHQWFPAFSLPVVSRNGHLIPLERGIIYSGDQKPSIWNIIVSPGRVWREATDGDTSRASFPFVLTDNYVGQARNGLAAFVFNEAGISHVAIQISQETSPVDVWALGNFVGIIPARYTPGVFTDAEQHILDFEEELAARPPVRPWSELPHGPFTQGYFRGGLPDETVSSAALLLDGRLYLQPAETRTGAFPYPEEMRHGVFSVTKSLCMGLAMFYAAQSYGEGVFDELITDHVAVLSNHPGWRGVTFENVLDMATGTRGSDGGEDIDPFIAARSAAEKLAAINSLPDASPQPGQVFNYASTNTFVLACALDHYVKSRKGPQADFWDMVREDVLRPLGIPHLPLVRTVEKDGTPGVPVMGWGSYPTVCEAAKIGQLLHEEGEFQGVQLLSRNKVREALSRTSRRGLGAATTGGHQEYYLHSFWIAPISLSTCRVDAPGMRGYGGNHVIIMPSGVIAVRFGDHNFYDVTPMVAVAEFYSSSCPGSGPSEAQVRGGGTGRR